MHFCTPLDPTAFLLRTKQCSGEILVYTVYGDVLNLSSELCCLLFTVAAANGSLAGARVLCKNPADYEILGCFLSIEPEQGDAVWKTEKSKID